MINLARFYKRFERTKELMIAAGFTNIQRFEGIDGFLTSDDVFHQLNIYTGRPGEKGCAASHLLVWKDFLENSDRDYLFIAEDDMLPHLSFRKIFPKYWAKTPDDFDLILVGNEMSCDKRRPLVVSEPSFCTHAYIISKKGAKKLLDSYQKIEKNETNMHVIDIFLINLMSKRVEYCKEPLRFYCYNGAYFPDRRKNIWPSRNSGICFQSRT